MTTIDKTSTRRPMVIGLVAVSFIGSILNVLEGIGILTLMSRGYTGSDLSVTSALVSLAIGLCMFVTSVLLLGYKRLGLHLGTAVFGAGMLWNLFMVTMVLHSTNNGYMLPLLINFLALYYTHKYLNHEPEKNFFT